jgi:hypothetical protein
MRGWLFVSLLLTALLLGTTFAHVLEISAKRRMDGALWTTLQQRLYRAFATVGGAVEIGAILTTAVLTWLVQGRPRGLAAGAFGCFLVAFALVWIGMVSQPPSLCPPDARLLQVRSDSISIEKRYFTSDRVIRS